MLFIGRWSSGHARISARDGSGSPAKCRPTQVWSEEATNGSHRSPTCVGRNETATADSPSGGPIHHRPVAIHFLTLPTTFTSLTSLR